MSNRGKPYKTYTREFNLEALRLMGDSDQPASQIAVGLGRRTSPTARGGDRKSEKFREAFKKADGKPQKKSL